MTDVSMTAISIALLVAFAIGVAVGRAERN